MNCYEDNIKELSKNIKNLDIVRNMLNVSFEKEYTVNFSKNNKIALLHNNKAITSILSPDDEARRLIDSYTNKKQKSSKYLLGVFSSIASYNHIDYFLGLNKLNTAVIIENNLSLIKLVLSSYYFESLSRVIIISENDFNILQHKLDENIKERDIINTLYIRHARASAISKDYYDNIDIIYSNIAKEKILSLKTLYYFSPIWARNIISNLIKNKGNSIDSFRGVLKNQTPLIIVSAGCSIDSKIENIKQLSKTHFVLALSHSVNTLIKNNIMPDAVVTTDGGFYSYPHLFSIKNSDIKIFTTHTSYPSIFNGIDKKKIYYFSHRESFESMLYPNTTYIPMCGSAIMPTVNIAYLLNPSYIVLAGSDFCYLDNNTHSRYSFARDYDFLSSNKLDTFENKNYRRLNIIDDKVLCYDEKYRFRSMSLKGYFRHFESLVKSIDKKFYTLTEESAKIDSIEIFDLLKAAGLENKNIKYRNITEKADKEKFMQDINKFFDEVEKGNTDTINSNFAYIIAPWHVDNSKCFSDFMENILSFKKLLFDV